MVLGPFNFSLTQAGEFDNVEGVSLVLKIRAVSTSTDPPGI